jgi:hypothetical protein
LTSKAPSSGDVLVISGLQAAIIRAAAKTISLILIKFFLILDFKVKIIYNNLTNPSIGDFLFAAN